MFENLLNIIIIGGLPLIFFILLLEGNPVVGAFIPGQILVMLLGFSISTLNVFNLYQVIPIIFLAGFLGDIFGFYLGKKYGFSLLKKINLNQDGILFRSTNNFFKKYGLFSIILGRQFNLTRCFIPFFSGLFKISFNKFILFAFISNLLWAFISIFLGYYFGVIIINKIDFLIKFIIFLIIYFSLLFLVYKGFKSFRVKNYLLFKDYGFMEIISLGFLYILLIILIFVSKYGRIQEFNEWFAFVYFPVLYYLYNIIFSFEFLIIFLDLILIFLIYKKDIKHLVIFIWGIIISFLIILITSIFLFQEFNLKLEISIIFMSILIFYTSIIIKNYVQNKKKLFYIEISLIFFLILSFLIKFAFSLDMYSIIISFVISLIIIECLILLSHYQILDQSLSKLHIK